MKKVLVVGENSYIGKSFAQFCCKKFDCSFISLRGDDWKKAELKSFDAVLFATGLAHIKESKENENLYFEVNRDLSFAFVKMAKTQGISQFVFLSSMSVYGKIEGEIHKETELMPNTYYGKSKLEAEKLILSLQDKNFGVCIVRPPMVYGKNCKGNFQSLIKIAKKLPFFPKIKNQRSMIYIDNLSCFLEKMIENSESGIFCPQNKDYVNTAKMIDLIAVNNGKKICLLSVLNPFIKFGSLFFKQIKKAFGNLTYSKDLSEYKENYNICEFEKSIDKS
ncbi:MAG: NAD-dependent epimerase/dehydratase family protein [Clostridia bacterium]